VVGQPELAWEGIASWLRQINWSLSRARAIVFLQDDARLPSLFCPFFLCSSQLPLRAFYRIGDCIYG